jgi:hypothetical protein
LGAKHIHEYFPNMVYELTGDVQSDMLFLFEIAQNPAAFRKSIDISAVKRKINLLENIIDLYV